MYTCAVVDENPPRPFPSRYVASRCPAHVPTLSVSAPLSPIAAIAEPVAGTSARGVGGGEGGGWFDGGSPGRGCASCGVSDVRLVGLVDLFDSM